MTSLEERIAAAEQRLRALKVRQVRTATRQRTRDARQKRQVDLRRKILVGAVVLDLVEQGKIETSLLKKWVEEKVAREEDRLLFAPYFEGDLGKSQATTENRSTAAATVGGGSASPP